MDKDIEVLRQEREQVAKDVRRGIIPKRVPVRDSLSLELLIEYSGKDLLTTQYHYNYEECVEIMEKAQEIVRGDNFGAAFARNPVAAMLIKGKTNFMSKSGFIQHPETCVMEEDEYDELIADPETFIGEKIIPRKAEMYSVSPMTFAISYLRNYLATLDQNTVLTSASRFIQEKYGYPMGGSTGSMTGVPFDEIADQYRGFRNITIDMKRQPQKVLDAMEALMPKNIAIQMPAEIDEFTTSSIMTHMGVFLNTKDFEKFYWPNFAKLCHIAGERGMHMYIFCEGDWTRFLDHLYDLPAGCQFAFEYGDPQKVKDKLGKKHIVGGFYPVTLLRNGTKQECLDKAKELIDILAPGGNFMWSYDKQALSLADIDIDNYIAVQEYVLNNTNYANAGQKASGEFDFMNFQNTVEHYLKDYPEFKSKHDLPFEEFIKDYPVPAERVIPYMKEAYEKYVSLVPYPKFGM
ncbi:MAG: uroporphyrinogen decarboxylase [Eubacteriaceae bacterium]|nr:uroporphyrinogen decarboxylase [Eubacteriaceae bacterium]